MCWTWPARSTTGAGSVLLGAGDDTLTIHDNTRIIGTVMAGVGNDTFNADIAGHADLGAVQQFETPSKTGEGVLNVNGPASSDFTTVNALAGTLNVAAGGSIAAQATTAAADATLQVAGSYTGTSGDDSFASRGTVIGALAFGAGNDSVDVIGGQHERRRAGGKRKRQALLCKVYKASLPNVPPNVPPSVAGLLMIHASTSVDSHATVLPVGVSERGRGNCPNRTHRYNVVRDTATRWSTSRKRSRRGAREAVVVSI